MRTLSLVLLILASIVIAAATDQYLFCPAYTFENTRAFSGDSIYNPYASVVARLGTL